MNVLVMRAGSWGSVLAGLLSRNGHSVSLVAPNEPLRSELLEHRENRRGLPGVQIPEAVRILPAPDEEIDRAEVILFPGPCDRMRQMARSVSDFDWKDRLIVTAAKGIEVGTLLRMSQVLGEELPGANPDRVVALSGPSFARYVAMGHPTTVVAASRSADGARIAQKVFANRSFRVYYSHDVVGVELGGALKNVIALAAGLCDGLGFGDNTRAALMTRGLAEITRLGVALGAEPMTFAGLSGMGDLVLTCSGRESRNHYVGEQIGKGKSLDEVLTTMVTVAEGVQTTKAALALAERQGVEMPIAREVHAVLFEGRRAQDALASLMMRDPKPEQWT